jgi:phosphoglycolate phosphatase-like HAD superfamily hydrolase
MHSGGHRPLAIDRRAPYDPRVNLAIFDLDGTLTNTNDVDALCYVRAVDEEFGIDAGGLNWADYTFVTDIGITIQMFQERLGRAPSDDEVERLRRRMVRLLEETFRASPEAFEPVAGAAHALAWLARHPDWTVGIAIGCWQATARMKLRAARISADEIAAAFCEDGRSREEVVRTAQRRALAGSGTAAFERVVSVGDGIWDVATAARLRVPFVGVRVDGSEEALRRRGVSHVVRDYTDLDALLHSLENAVVPEVA